MIQRIGNLYKIVGGIGGFFTTNKPFDDSILIEKPKRNDIIFVLNLEHNIEHGCFFIKCLYKKHICYIRFSTVYNSYDVHNIITNWFNYNLQELHF